MMRLGYFPGCSLSGTAREYDQSTKAIAGPLDLRFEEVGDWNCCGATSAHATNHLLSIALPARNLMLAEAQGLEKVIAPCAACYSRLAAARHEMASDRVLTERIMKIVGRPYDGKVRVASVVEVLRDIASTIKEKAALPLSGMKVACYYGCLLVRPPEITGWDDPESPTSMETVVSATGATPVPWNMRLECCGGGFSLSRTSSVIRLGRTILESARDAGAQAVVVACPMCQSNLDFRQKAISQRSSKPVDLPVLYITQLVGLALGVLPEKLGLKSHYVDPMPLVTSVMAPKAAEKPGESA